MDNHSTSSPGHAVSFQILITCGLCDMLRTTSCTNGNIYTFTLYDKRKFSMQYKDLYFDVSIPIPERFILFC